MHPALLRARLRLPTLLLLGACFTSAPGHALEVTLSGYSELGAQSRGYGGLLTLSVPLDNFAFTSLAQSAEEPEDPEFSDPDYEQSEPLPTGSDQKPAPEPQRARNLSPQGTGSSAEPTESVRLREPVLDLAFVRRLMNAAQQEFMQGEQRLSALDSRATTSAWLPELKLKAGHNSDQSLRLTPTETDPGRYQVSGAADLRLEAQATWKLHRLVFATEELTVERLRVQLEEQRKRQMAQLLELLLAWRTAFMNEQKPDLADDERWLWRIKTAQAALELDVLTHGAFSKELAKRSPALHAPRPAGQ